MALHVVSDKRAILPILLSPISASLNFFVVVVQVAPPPLQAVLRSHTFIVHDVSDETIRVPPYQAVVVSLLPFEIFKMLLDIC